MNTATADASQSDAFSSFSVLQHYLENGV